MPAVVFQGSKVKTLKDTLNLNGGSDIITSTTDPTTSAVSAEPGSLLLNKTTGFVYRKLDSGSSTNWTLVGSEAGGAKSYATGNDSTADSALGSGWTTADVTAYPPTTYSGGTVTATFARTTSSPLQGAGSMLFTPGGQYDSAVFTFPNGIDRADFARMHRIEFDYEIGTVASYTDGDVKLAVVCASDSGFTTDVQVIQPAGHSISKVSGQETHVATFQSHASNLYYKIFLVQTTASTGYTLKIDNFKVGPQSVAYGAPVTDWVSYTPSKNDPSIISSITGRWRRVGDQMEVMIHALFNSGPSGATYFQFGLPSGHSIDTSDLAAATSGQQVVGTANWYDNGVGYKPGSVYISATDKLNGLLGSPNYDGWHSGIVANGDFVTIHAKVPILGWSSNVVVSDSADTRVVSFRGTNGSTQSLTAGTTRIAVTAVSGGDTHNAWDGDEYVIPVPGNYVVLVKTGDNSGSTVGFDLYVDGNNYGRVHNSYATSAGENGSGLILVPGLKAGQRLDVRCNSTITAAPSTISIFMLSGPAQIAASESVSARYMVNGSTSNTVLNNNTTEIIDFNLKDWDSHGAVTTGASWKFTAPLSGEYEIKVMSGVGSGAWNAGEFFQLELYKGGAVNQGLGVDFKQATATQDTFSSGTGSIKLLSGEYIDIRAYQNTGFNVNFSTNSALHWVSIRRVGNY